MLNLILRDEKYFYDKNVVYLTKTSDIEREFVRILNYHKDAFWSEKSLALMESIDTAKRQGDYGVITKFGSSCITCLSTGCKFGLLVLYYKKFPKLKLVVTDHVTGKNVWEWLAEYGDVTLYMIKENIENLYNISGEFQLWYEGKWYNHHDRKKIWEIDSICSNIAYTMTKETEKTAYEHFSDHRSEVVCSNVKEEILLAEFIKRFSDYENIISYIEDTGKYDYHTYKVINYCSEIPQEFHFRRHPLYVCGKRGDTWECRKINSVKYPEFLELLYFDVLDGCYYVWQEREDEEHPFFSEYEMWFVLVLEGNENCPIKDYPKSAILGIEVEKKEKEIRIFNKNKAVKRFHTLYEKIGYTYY